VPSYNKNIQILKQQSIQKVFFKISLTMAIATVIKELQVSLNKQLQTTYKNG